MRLGELANALATPGFLTIEGDAEVTGVSHDSTAVAPGDLFCCVPGERSDGHAFAGVAHDAGAVALLVERSLARAVPQVQVESVRRAMGPVASRVYGEPSRALQIVGVTGTNGKTTTTHLVEAIGNAASVPAGVIGTVGMRMAGRPIAGDLTTPEGPDLQRVLAQMRDGGVGLVAMEVSSHALELHRVDGTWFTVAAFLNLSHDHLDFHGSLERYFAAKASLFDSERVGVAVVNIDDPHGTRLVRQCEEGGLRAVTFAVEPVATEAADVAATDVRVSTDGTTFTLDAPAWGHGGSIRSRLVGRFNVANSAAAAAAALAAGFDWDSVVAGLQADVKVPGRFERVDRGQPFAVLVDYAHTPDALAHALAAGRELATGRVLVVFGCGGDRDRAKRPAMGRVAADGSDVMYITSDNPRSEDPDVIVAEILAGVPEGALRVVEVDRRQAIERAVVDARAGDVVLVAGKGHESGQIIGASVRPFDDRAVVAEALEGLPCI